jgi:arsenate reductase
MKLYGISQCNTVKKSRDWLSENHVNIEFHDYKKNGLTLATLQNWLKNTKWDQLINRKGTTWRGLTEDKKLSIQDEASALTLMLEKTSIIKRPILEDNGRLLHIGFDAEAYRTIFKV